MGEQEPKGKIRKGATPSQINSLYGSVRQSVGNAHAVLNTTPASKFATDTNDPHTTVRSKASKVVNACLEPAQLVANLLQALGTLYPPCSVVGEILSAAVQLEQDRRENDARIVAVYVELSDFLSEWGRLWQKLKDYPASELESFMGRIGALIKDFGTFSEQYHNDNAFVSIYKHLIHSKRNRETLADFLGKIENYRGRLTRALLGQVADQLGDKNSAAHSVKVYVTYQTDPERRAASYVEKHGGENVVKNNDGLLMGVLDILGPDYTTNLSSELLRNIKESWADARAQSETVFNIKFNFALQQIQRDIKYWGEEILKQFKAGPHMLIPDEDKKDIWLNTAGKECSIKRRRFLDGMNYYFQYQFKINSERMYQDDAWTSSVISKVCYHPAIGDAIDDDASGYISVGEVVNFLQKKPKELGWTVPTWIAYCAYGWDADNLRYQAYVLSIFGQIRALAFSSSNGMMIQELYVDVVQERLMKISSSLYQIFDDLPPVVAARMDRIRAQWRKQLEERVIDHLRAVNYKIDPSSVSAITGNERIEWTFMMLLAVLLSHHLRVFGRPEFVKADVEAAASEMEVVFRVYDDRVCELKRIWRCQRLDLNKQMRYYANGLFEDYYKHYGVVRSDKNISGRKGEEEQSRGEESAFETPSAIKTPVRIRPTEISRKAFDGFLVNDVLDGPVRAWAGASEEFRGPYIPPWMVGEPMHPANPPVVAPRLPLTSRKAVIWD